jgi:hypothetical protein
MEFSPLHGQELDNKLDEFLGNAQVSRFNPERYQKILQTGQAAVRTFW